MSKNTFSLKRNTTEIVLENEGAEVTCELKEMTAAKRDVYLQKLSSRVETGADGQPTGVSDFAGMQAELIQTCITKKGGGELSIETIQEWPASVVTSVYALCQEMNGLSQATEEDGTAKNE